MCEKSVLAVLSSHFFYPSWMKKVDFAKSRPAADGAIVCIKKNQMVFSMLLHQYIQDCISSLLSENLWNEQEIRFT